MMSLMTLVIHTRRIASSDTSEDSGRTGDALISGTSTVRVNGLKSFLIHSLSRQVIVNLKSTKMEIQVLSSFV